MREVGAFEAKNRLGHLLDLVEQGEVVVITRHGKQVARLVPARPIRSREQAREAIATNPRPRRAAQAWPLRLVRLEILPGRGSSVSLVLDSSATLAWIYSDETTEPIRRVFQAVADDGAVVPALWRLEIANSLTVAVRRGRIDANFRRAALTDLAFLDITTDDHTDVHAWGETLNVADRFQLTVYDAAYLELAQRRTLPLATLDSELGTAAKALGLRVVGTD